MWQSNHVIFHLTGRRLEVQEQEVEGRSREREQEQEDRIGEEEDL